MSLGETIGVGSVVGGGRYDELVGMFDANKKHVSVTKVPVSRFQLVNVDGALFTGSMRGIQRGN